MVTAKMAGCAALSRPTEIAPEPWRPARFEPAWVETANERNFLAMMETLRQGAGEGRFGVVWDQAGRGKTRTTARWAAQHRAPHLLMLEIWRSSSVSRMGFLQKLCKELGITAPPRSINGCFGLAVDRLLDLPAPDRVVFLDEMDKTPKYLDLVRDLAELSAAAVILIGEESMPALMSGNRRVWSRTLDAVQFQGADAASLMQYGHASAGLKIDLAAAELLSRAPMGGDWRAIKKRLLKIIGLANARRTREITPALAKAVLQEEMGRPR